MNSKVQKIAGIGMFATLVIIMQMIGSFIHFGPFSISLVLLPIVVGSALYGVAAGAILGFVFGMAVLLSGDAALFLAVTAIGTIITVIGKGILAGLLTALVYNLLSKKINPLLAVMVAAIVCAVTNTGCFLIGCELFFMETIAGWAEASGFRADVGKYMIFGLVGGNFIFELITNIVLSPVALRLIQIGKTKH